MLQFDDLTERQKRVIKDIAIIQLNSLRRIYNNNHHADVDIELYLAREEIEKGDFEYMLEKRIEFTQSIRKNPDNVGRLREEDLSVFKHILSNIEEKYQARYKESIKGLWKKLFFLEEFYSQSLN